MTVLNEVNSLPHLLDSLVEQTRVPDQIVVCDGGSSDGTLELLRRERRLGLRVMQRPGANISQGRNAAIEAAEGDVIAVTDAGVRLRSQWLEEITAPLKDQAVHAVGGAFVAVSQTAFETAMGATVIPTVRQLANQDRYPPSSRSFAFRKSAWQAVGGYPAWIDYCEDVIFDLRLQARFGPFAFAPQAVAEFRPRPDLPAFWHQYYRYARGDGKANLWPRQHLARYAAYLGGLVLLLCGIILYSWALMLLSAMWLGGVIALRSLGAYRRLTHTGRQLTLLQKLRAALWVPVIRITGDVAKMLGYPVGVWWRWRHRNQIPDWRHP